MLGMILGPDGIIVIAVVGIVLIFGGKKLPELARSLGSASHEFKRGTAQGDPSAQLPKSDLGTESGLGRDRDERDAIDDRI